MTLEEFAKKAGMRLTKCDASWGGTIGYKEADHPNCEVCGFRTEKAAYKHWLSGSFGKKMSSAIEALLKETQKV